MAKGVVMGAQAPAPPPRPDLARTVSDADSPISASVPPVILDLTPIVLVSDLRPCLAFWVEGLGFSAVKVVPGGDGEPVFALLEGHGLRLMYQTRASVLAELPKLKATGTDENAVLYLRVPTLKGLSRLISGRKFSATILQGPKLTPHGTQEMSLLVKGVGILVFSAPGP